MLFPQRLSASLDRTRQAPLGCGIAVLLREQSGQVLMPSLRVLSRRSWRAAYHLLRRDALRVLLPPAADCGLVLAACWCTPILFTYRYSAGSHMMPNCRRVRRSMTPSRLV